MTSQTVSGQKLEGLKVTDPMGKPTAIIPLKRDNDKIISNGILL